MNKDPLENWKKSQELWRLVEVASQQIRCEKKVLMAHRRQQPACFARQVVMALARRRGYQVAEIARFFGCHQGSVYNATEAVANAIEFDSGIYHSLAFQIAIACAKIKRYHPQSRSISIDKR